MLYSELTLQHFETPTACGELAGPGVLRGAAGSIADGVWVQFDVRIGVAKPATILDARFRAFGCPHVIAVTDWLCRQMVGRAAAALPWSVADLRVRFDAPIEKLGKLLVIEDAWIAAMQDRGRA